MIVLTIVTLIWLPGTLWLNRVMVYVASVLSLPPYIVDQPTRPLHQLHDGNTYHVLFITFNWLVNVSTWWLRQLVVVVFFPNNSILSIQPCLTPVYSIGSDILWFGRLARVWCLCTAIELTSYVFDTLSLFCASALSWCYFHKGHLAPVQALPKPWLLNMVLPLVRWLCLSTIFILHIDTLPFLASSLHCLGWGLIGLDSTRDNCFIRPLSMGFTIPCCYYRPGWRYSGNLYSTSINTIVDSFYRLRL